MMLEYVQGITTADVEETATAVALAIPHWTPLRTRIALQNAVNLTKMTNLGFVHSLTAAAFQYGISRGGFENATAYVVIVDVGATQSQAGLFRFEPPASAVNASTRIRLAESLGTITTLAVEALPEEGGSSLDRCVATIFDDAIAKERGTEHYISTPGVPRREQRTYALLRAARAAKEGLSINNVVQVTIEAADLDGVDFVATIGRDEFDRACAEPFAAKVGDLVTKLLVTYESDRAEVQAQLRVDANVPDLMVEFVGAGSRVPAVGSAVSRAVAVSKAVVGRRLNTDDSVALGAAYLAARASPIMRIRGFAVRDHLPCARAGQLSLSVDDAKALPATMAPTPLSTSAVRHIFEDCTELPCRRSVSVRVSSESVPPEKVSFTIASPAGYCTSQPQEPTHHQSFTIHGISEAVNEVLNSTKLRAENVVVTVRTELHLSTDGTVEVHDRLIRVSKAKQARDEAESINPEALTKKDGKDSKRHSYTDASFAAPPKKGKSTYAAPHFYFFDSPLPMNRSHFSAAQNLLSVMSTAETAARDAAVKKNDLETFLLMEKTEARHADNQEAQKAFVDVSSWLESGRGSHEDCSADEFEQQHNLLQAAIASSPTLRDEL
jgi:hypothetical protein